MIIFNEEIAMNKLKSEKKLLYLYCIIIRFHQDFTRIVAVLKLRNESRKIDNQMNFTIYQELPWILQLSHVKQF